MPRPRRAAPSSTDAPPPQAQAGALTQPADPLAVVWRPVDAIRPAPDNPRVIPPAAVEAVAESIRAFGWRVPLIVDRHGVIIAGHTRLRAAQALGMEAVPVVVAADLSSAQAAALRVIDNRAADLTGWDVPALSTALAAIAGSEVRFDLDLGAFQFDDVLGGLSSAGILAGDEEEEEGPRPPSTTGDPAEPADEGDDPADVCPDPAPEDAPAASVRGEVYHLGPHVVACGSATDPEVVARLLAAAGVEAVDGILADPPYCSGGFQESNRLTGGIGSKRKTGQGTATKAPRIAGDTLSTRGFQALIRSTLETWRPAWAFVFTDWRMWANLWDVCEASGVGVRAMVVWDKGTPGMGRGFRAQHELIAVAARDGSLAAFDPKASRGNVIRCGRSGNPLHPTQKPVALLRALLDTATFLQVVGDPFGGSGSTLIACAEAGRRAILTEVEPRFCDVIRRRWGTWAREHGQDPGPGAL